MYSTPQKPRPKVRRARSVGKGQKRPAKESRYSLTSTSPNNHAFPRHLLPSRPDSKQEQEPELVQPQEREKGVKGILFESPLPQQLQDAKDEQVRPSTVYKPCVVEGTLRFGYADRRTNEQNKLTSSLQHSRLYEGLCVDEVHKLTIAANPSRVLADGY